MDRTPQAESLGQVTTGTDQLLVLSGISWNEYSAYLRARGERPRPRLAYLDGELEIVTTSLDHELVRTMLDRLLWAYAEETGLPLNTWGSPTYRKRAKAAGVEPDDSYCVGDRRRSIPNLAIDVAFTSGGIDKLEIYRDWALKKSGFGKTASLPSTHDRVASS